MMNSVKRTVAVAALVAGLAGPTTSQAGGVPTIDVASIAELIALLNTNIDMLEIDEDILGNAQDQLSKLEETYAALTGAHASIAGLFDEDIGPRQIATSLTDLAETGSSSNPAVTSRISSLRSGLSIMEGADFFGDPAGTLRSELYDMVSDSNVTALAVSEQSFAEGAAAMGRYDSYRKEIGKTDDLKASLDLNSRIAVENGMMIAALLQSLSLQNRMTAVQATAGQRDMESTVRAAGDATDMLKEIQ